MRPSLLMTLLLVMLFPASAQREAPDLQAKLNTRVAQYRLSASGLADALIKTSEQFQLPIGIEWVKDKQTLRGFDHTWKDETVRQVFRSIVDAYPSYASSVEGGVIHVFRQDLLSDARNFLNLKLPDFFQVRGESAGLANQGLRSVVQNVVSPRNLPPGAGEGGSYATGLQEKPVTLIFRDATVRQALEKLVDASEHKIWIVTFSDTTTLTPTGYYRTETLWHPAPFRNTEQPMWDFLSWEEYGARPASH